MQLSDEVLIIQSAVNHCEIYYGYRGRGKKKCRMRLGADGRPACLMTECEHWEDKIEDSRAVYEWNKLIMQVEIPF